NVICCDLALHSAMRSRVGEEFFNQRFNIGVWSWELPVFPRKWYDRFAYYDEIWAPSAFLTGVFAPVSPIPVVRIPPVLSLDRAETSCDQRGQFSLSKDEFLFAFVFNFQSRYQRKNPLALIDAFVDA